MSMIRPLLSVFLLQFSIPALAHPYNATTDFNNIVCVYPVSGQYGLLNRILFYLLWIIALCCQGKWTWPTIGCLAYVMSYAAATAMHCLLLAVTSANSLYDLDVPAAWCILSCSLVLAAPLVWYSDKIRHSAYRPLFGFWCTVVSIGSICCITAFNRDYPEESACWSQTTGPTKVLLTQAEQLLVPNRFNCTYSCFNTRQLTRTPSDITVVTAKRAFGVLYRLSVSSMVLAGLTGLVYCTLACCCVADRKRTEAELREAKKIPRNATPKERRQAYSARKRAQKELDTGEYQQASCKLLFLNPVVAPIIIVFNEVYLLMHQALPESEAPYAVGQWAPWVTVGLALIGAAINARYAQRWATLEAILRAEKDELTLRKLKASIPKIKLDIESGVIHEQNPWFQAVVDEAMSKTMPAIEQSNPDLTPSLAQVKHPKALGNVQTSRKQATSSPVPTSIRPSDARPIVVKNELAQGHGRVLKARNHVCHLQYDPPFQLHKADGSTVRVDQMTTLQYIRPCEAYDDAERELEGFVLRDSNGKDWIVQKGILWHKELWEQP